MTVTDANECASIKSVTIEVVSGNKEVVLEDMKIYPNPVNDILNIQINRDIAMPVKLKIFNLTGSVVYEENVLRTNGYRVDLSNLVTGTYLLFIQNGDKVHTQKLIKE